jgi:hypothetical protein
MWPFHLTTASNRRRLRYASPPRLSAGVMNRGIVDSLTDRLLYIVFQSNLISDAFERAVRINLPNWCIGSGCIAQTVWNHFHGYSLESFISDVDLVYFDPTDLSFEAEDAVIQQAAEYFEGFSTPVDIKNQARVHLWVEEKFGYNISPYKSVENAIDTWPTTSTAVALRPNGSTYTVYAPYGLDDLFSLTIRPNKVQITKEIYEIKCQKWGKCWPKLKFELWETNS